MGHKHSRDEILAAAVAVAQEEGLSRLSFGRVAARLGIADRTVVYYFGTTTELVTAVLTAVGEQLQATLARAFQEQAPDHRSLARAAWPVLATPDVDPTFALFFEAAGLAAAGRQPYRVLVPALVQTWVDWASTFIEADSSQARAEARAAVALLDGLLLLRQLAGPDAAESAAAALGVA